MKNTALTNEIISKAAQLFTWDDYFLKTDSGLFGYDDVESCFMYRIPDYLYGKEYDPGIVFVCMDKAKIPYTDLDGYAVMPHIRSSDALSRMRSAGISVFDTDSLNNILKQNNIPFTAQEMNDFW